MEVNTMLKIKKSFIFLFIAFTMLFSQIAIAGDVEEYIGEGVYVSSIQYEEDVAQIQQRIPNIVAAIITKVDNNNVKIGVKNWGIDKFDSIKFDVKITDKDGIVQYKKTQLAFTDIWPLINQSINVHVKNWAKVEITNINCKDGTDTGILPNVSLTN